MVSARTRKDLPNGGEYLMTLYIGMPMLSYPAIADTGSDLIWTQWMAGVQSMETFTFGSAPADQARVPGIAFGCSNASSDDWNGSAGLVGLGRGSLSLVSQLGAGRFSYCLMLFQDTNSTSTLLLGPSAALKGTGVVRSTPFTATCSTSPSACSASSCLPSRSTTPLLPHASEAALALFLALAGRVRGDGHIVVVTDASSVVPLVLAPSDLSMLDVDKDSAGSPLLDQLTKGDGDGMLARRNSKSRVQRRSKSKQ
ncbi:hypothetical protein EJB05_56220, partial [Eragrostis curvula]